MASKTRASAATKSKVTVQQRQAVETGRRFALFAFAFSGMAALIYEVLWTRELSLIFGSTVYAVSMMLAAFMSGLSLGAILGGRWADRAKSLFFLFGSLELGIAIFGLLTIPLVQALPTLYFFVYDAIRPSFALFFIIQLLLSYVIMLIPTTFMGATFPVVAKINTTSLEELGNDVGNAYSVNTIGSIFGSLAAGFLLIPLIGVKATTFVAAGLNLAVSLTMLSLGRAYIKKSLLYTGGALLIVAAGIGFFTEHAAYAHNFYRIGYFETYAAYQEYRSQLETIYFEDDIHGRIVVFEQPDGIRSLSNSGKIEGSNAPFDKQTTSLLALLPIVSAGSPQSVLIIGLGTGFTTLSALRMPVKEVDTVEINKSVVPASKLFVGDAIEGDERSTIHINDARNYLYTTDKTYDVITSEPSYPLSTHVSHLFTREFYELARSKLNNNGVYCQWIPRYMLKREDTFMMFKTFQSVFPQTYVWASNSGQNRAVDLMLIGINGDRQIDATAVANAVKGAATQQLDFEFYTGPEILATMTSNPEIPLNTDDKPLLEFVTPRNQIEFFQQSTKPF